MKSILKVICTSFLVLMITTSCNNSSSPNNYDGYRTLDGFVSLNFDASNQKDLINRSDNIFVAKVKKLKSYENLDIPAGIDENIMVSWPYTTFYVEVVDNIKGDLKNEVIVSDMYGINEEEKTLVKFFEREQIKVNNYYILFTTQNNNIYEIHPADSAAQILDIQKYEDLKLNETYNLYLQAYQKLQDE